MDDNPYKSPRSTPPRNRAPQSEGQPPKRTLAQLIWHWVFIDISPKAILLPFLIMFLVVMTMLALIYIG